MTAAAEPTTPAAWQGLVDDRLDAVERILLRAGTARTERQTIIDDVQGQILALLERRTEGREPTRADVLAVLAALDPPESFVPEAAGPRRVEVVPPVLPPQPPPAPPLPATRQASVTAYVGGGLAAGAYLAGFLAVVVGVAAEAEELVLGGAVVVLMMAVAALVCGILGLRQIGREPHRYHGVTAAAFALVPCPCLLGLVATYFLVALADSEMFLLVGVVLPGLTVPLALTILAARLWRRVRQLETPAPR